MKQADAKKRRKKISEAVKEGESVVDVAGRFGVCPTTVYISCAEFEVSVPRQSRTIPSTGFAILFRLLKGEKPGDVAKLFRVTKQRVSAVATTARTEGFVIPEKKKYQRR